MIGKRQRKINIWVSHHRDACTKGTSSSNYELCESWVRPCVRLSVCLSISSRGTRSGAVETHFYSALVIHDDGGERDIHKRTHRTGGRCFARSRTNGKQDRNLRSLLRRRKTTTDTVRLWLHCDALETSVRDQMIAPGVVWGKKTPCTEKKHQQKRAIPVIYYTYLGLIDHSPYEAQEPGGVSNLSV